MPVFQLSEELVFPDPALAEPNGLLAVGGDLSPRRLLVAYASGIFPWPREGLPMLWWALDPRFVLDPSALHLGRSVRKALRRRGYRVTMDTAFARVIESCSRVPRVDQDGTWITPEMCAAYTRLHELGYAHSVEVWDEETLVGGLYGVSLGSAFFGESMFTRAPDASKIGFVRLMTQLRAWAFTLVDCQMETQHLGRLGARSVPFREFRGRLEHALETETRCGVWSFDDDVAGP